MFTFDSAGHDGPTPQPGAPTLDEQIADTLKASISESDPIKRTALTEKLTALNKQRWPDDNQGADPQQGSESSGPGSPAGDPAPSLMVPATLTDVQREVVAPIAADLGDMAKDLGLPTAKVQRAMTFAIQLDALDQSSGFDRSDANAAEIGWSVLTAKYGPEGALSIADGARKAVQALGPKVAAWLQETGYGNTPSVLVALDAWGKGYMKNTPEQARAKLATGKGLTDLQRLIYGMIASESD